MMRDALEDCYLKRCAPANTAVPQHRQASLKAMLKKLPPGLANDEHCRTLRRACNLGCQVTERQPYTHKEQQDAAYAFCCESKKDHHNRKEVFAKWGISPGELKRLREQLMDKVSNGRVTDQRLRKEADIISFKQAGNQPLMSEAEGALLFARGAERGGMGHGLSTSLTRHEGREMCKEIAKYVPDPKVAARPSVASTGAATL